MQDFGTKADNSPPPGGQLSAAEFNNLATELENAVLRSGQTLSGASVTQFAQSLFLHGVKSESFQDSGAANAYVATPISGTNGVLLPATYTNLPGAVIAFKASNANSGASTLNIGQTTGTLLGTKAIRTQADAVLPAGSILAGQYIQLVYNPAFDSGNGAWELRPWSANGGKLLNIQIVTASGTVTKTPGATKWAIRGCGGGGQGGGTQATGASQVATGGGASAGATAETLFDVTALVSATAVIGVGGNTGGAGAAGQTGGSTTLTMGANSLTLPGGTGGGAGAATSSLPNDGGSAAAFSVAPSHVGALAFEGTSGGGATTGINLSLASAQSGIGGSSIFGASRQSGNATGFGAGGPGGRSLVSTGANQGPNGSPGILIIYEYT